MSALSSFVTRSDRRECGSCKVHFSSHMHSCPNCGQPREDSVTPRRRFRSSSATPQSRD